MTLEQIARWIIDSADPERLSDIKARYALALYWLQAVADGRYESPSDEDWMRLIRVKYGLRSIKGREILEAVRQKAIGSGLPIKL